MNSPLHQYQVLLIELFKNVEGQRHKGSEGGRRRRSLKVTLVFTETHTETLKGKRVKKRVR